MASEAPASTSSPATAIERPQPQLQAIGDEDEHLTTGHQLHDYPDPINHGHGIQAVLQDKVNGPNEESFYTRLFHGWQHHVGDREHEPHVLVEDVHRVFDWLHDDFPAHLVLTSKGWKVGTGLDPEKAGPDAGMEALSSQYYEYSLQVMRYDEDTGTLDRNHDRDLRAPISFQCWVQPHDTDLLYPSGDSMVCQHGEGTNLKTQTTYAGPKDSLVRTIEVANLAAAALDVERPAWTELNRDSWKVWKGEVHHRFAKSKMKTVVHRLGEAKTLLQYGGGDISTKGKMRNGRHVEEMVVSPRWDKLGIAKPEILEDATLGVKVYRIRGNPADERLRHPKVEAYLAGTDGEKVHADDWQIIRRVLRQLVNTFAVRASINLGELREDEFYKPRDRPMIDYYHPEGWRHAVKKANKARLGKMADIVHAAQTPSKLDIVYTIADRNGASYDDLEDATGLSRSRIQEIVAEFVDRDVLLRASMPRIIVFDNEDLRLSALDELQGTFPEDAEPQAIDDRAEQRRERRQEKREDDGSDSSSRDSQSDDAASSGQQDDEESPEWARVDQLDYSREDVGRYLQRGDIPAEDAKIRVAKHRWLGDPA